MDVEIGLPVSGRCDYLGRVITIGEQNAEDAYFTLTHEVGHWLFFEAAGFLPQALFPVFLREFFADLLGWKLRRRLDGRFL